MWDGPRRRQPPSEGTLDAEAGDADLVLAARLDTRAFASLYLRYRDDVLRYAYYCLGDWDEAADAAQEIFTHALAGLPRLRDGGGFRGWLFRIAHNEICDRQNHRRTRSMTPWDDALGLHDPAPSPEHLAMVNDDHARLLALLGRLPADRRRVCELRFAGLTDREIATVLGKHEGAVRTSWSRAAAQLRDLMGIVPAREGAQDA